MEVDSDMFSSVHILSNAGVKNDFIDNFLRTCGETLDQEYFEHCGARHVAIDIVMGALQLKDEPVIDSEFTERLQKVFEIDIVRRINLAIDAFQDHYSLLELVRMWILNTDIATLLPILDSRNFIKMPISRPNYVKLHLNYDKETKFIMFCSGGTGKYEQTRHTDFVAAIGKFVESNLHLNSGYWHGTTGDSACNIINYGIDINTGEKNRDFGQGFYLNTNLYDAINYAIQKSSFLNKTWAGVVAFEKPEASVDRPWFQFTDTTLDNWEEFVVANRLPDMDTSRETIVKYYEYFAIEGRIAQRKPPTKPGKKTWDAICPLGDKKQLALKKPVEAQIWDYNLVKIFFFSLEEMPVEDLPKYEETTPSIQLRRPNDQP